MARPPKAFYNRGAWRTDFGGVRNRVLVRGVKNADTKFQAEKELLRLREEACLLQQSPGLNTPFVTVVERFLAEYVGRPAYADFSNELHWFMGMDLAADPDNPVQRAGNNLASGGRFGIACKNWPLHRINAKVVEDYLRRRKDAGLSGYHAFVALRTLMNWAVKKDYLPRHDLDRIDSNLRRKGRRKYLPADAVVAQVFQQAAQGKFKDILHVYMHTGIRPSELRTVSIDEFDRPNRQWVLHRHKTVHHTGMPKIVPLASDEVFNICVAHAGDRPGDQPLFLNNREEPWTYNALRERWYRLRKRLQVDPRFTLYSLRHWYLTKAIELGESEAIVSELAGHADRATIDYYKKLRNGPLHQAAIRVAAAIERAGIGGSPVAPETSAPSGAIPVEEDGRRSEG